MSTATSTAANGKACASGGISLTDAALDLAATGLPVFPCSGRKLPCIPKTKGGHGHKDASTDPAEIRRMFAHPASKLIGVPTGERSGIDILDLDPRHGSDAWREANIANLPETRIHQTGGGGEHWVFRHVEGVRNLQDSMSIAAGVDVRGEGGYCIWPGSPGYTVISDADVAPWPAWLLELVLPKQKPAKRPAGKPQQRTDQLDKRHHGYIRALLANVSAAPEGAKHDTLLKQARAMGGIIVAAGISESDAHQWLMDALPDTVQDWENAKKTATAGLQHGMQEPFDHLEDRPRPNGQHHAPQDDPGYWRSVEEDAARASEAPDDEMDGEADEPKADPELLWRAPVNRESAIPRRIYIVPGYIQRGVITEIVGPGGHGKSLLFLIWAVALALGIPVGEFRPTRPMRVTTMDVEDDLDEQDRRVAAILRMFDKHHSDLGDRLRIMNPSRTGMVLHFDPITRKLRRTGLMAELIEAIHSFKPDLLMLNPLGELHNAEENDNGTLRRIVGDIRVLAKQENIGLLLGHHTRKGAPEHGNPDAGRGASSISGVVRKSFTLYEMTEAEAAGWKIPDPRMFFRLDGAKANYDKKNATEWFERKIHTLDNQDTVVAATPWFPPCEAITDAMITILMGIVEAGDMGKPWSKRLGKYDRSISRAMVRNGIETRDGQEKALDLLMGKGCHECAYVKPDSKPAMGLRHPSGGPGVPWKQ